jgi:hypothetical protein
MLTDDEIKALLDEANSLKKGLSLRPNASPSTIAELCTRLLSAEERLSQIADLDSFGTALVSKERDAALAKVKVLEAALREMVYEATHLSPNVDGSHTAKISGSVLAFARTALQEQTNATD